VDNNKYGLASGNAQTDPLTIQAAGLSEKAIKQLQIVKPFDSGIATGDWLEPPINPETITALLRLNALHESAIHLRTRLVCAGYRPHELNLDHKELPEKPTAKQRLDFFRSRARFLARFPKSALYAFVFDRSVFGYGALQIVQNRGKSFSSLRRLNARVLRITKKGLFGQLDQGKLVNTLAPEQVIYSFQPCPESDFYGVPEYSGAITDIALAAAAKGQRIHFYNSNGLVSALLLLNVNFQDWITPEAMAGKTPDEIAEMVGDIESKLVDAIRTSNTPGGSKQVLLNFRGILKDQKIEEIFKFVDLSQSLAKDDFDKTTAEARLSIYEAHQIPAELINTAFIGKSAPDFNKVLANYYRLVVAPIAEQIAEEINAQLDPQFWIKLDPNFDDLLRATGAGDAGDKKGPEKPGGEEVKGLK